MQSVPITAKVVSLNTAHGEVYSTSAYMDFPYNVLTGHVIYTTLSCENNAGLTSVLSSNGVKISNQPKLKQD
jgi:hypothetical protein